MMKLLSRRLRIPQARDRRSEGARLLEAVFPTDKSRKSASPVRRQVQKKPVKPEAQRLLEAVFGQHPHRKKAASRPGVRVGIGSPVKLRERSGGGVEAVLRREIPHAGELSARDFGRLRFLLGRAEMMAKMQSPRGRGQRGALQKRLAASWSTRLERDVQGISLVLENRSAHAVYLAMGTKHIKPRAVFKGALAAQQGAIDGEWQRLAKLAQMRYETREQLRAAKENGTQSLRLR